MQVTDIDLAHTIQTQRRIEAAEARRVGAMRRPRPAHSYFGMLIARPVSLRGVVSVRCAVITSRVSAAKRAIAEVV